MLQSTGLQRVGYDLVTEYTMPQREYKQTFIVNNSESKMISNTIFKKINQLKCFLICKLSVNLNYICVCVRVCVCLCVCVYFFKGIPSESHEKVLRFFS